MKLYGMIVRFDATTQLQGRPLSGRMVGGTATGPVYRAVFATEPMNEYGSRPPAKFVYGRQRSEDYTMTLLELDAIGPFMADRTCLRLPQAEGADSLLDFFSEWKRVVAWFNHSAYDLEPLRLSPPVRQDFNRLTEPEKMGVDLLVGECL